MILNEAQKFLSHIESIDMSLTKLVNYCIATCSKDAPHEHKRIETKGWYFFHPALDPLDYIYIFRNEEDTGVPRHWHYVGLGLTDIHGLLHISRQDYPDLPQVQRYPPKDCGAEQRSGFGFELTFRLACDNDESWAQDAPDWPCHIMQKIARHVFSSKLIFNAGDNLSWHQPLEEDSRIEDFLMTIDPQLKIFQTGIGEVKFIQLVGVCRNELQAAKASSVNEILDILKEDVETGGKYLVTDMRRGHTIFESNPANLDRVLRRIDESGSDMAGITAKHKYSSSEPKWFKHESDSTFTQAKGRSECVRSNPYGIERGTFASTVHDFESSQCIQHDNQSRNPSRMSCESESALQLENLENAPERFYDKLYLLLSYESASILPVILRGRLKHKRVFHYKSWEGDLATTLVPEGCWIRDSLVTRERRFARKGILLQIYIPNELLDDMIETLKDDFHDSSLAPDEYNKKSDLKLPKNYSWEKFGLHLTVVDKIRD